jgi:hypothetical protein
MVYRRVGQFGHFEALGQETDAAINLAQPFFPIEIVAVFRPVPVAGGPVHDVDHLRPLDVDQVQQFGPQSRISGRRDVVAGTSRNLRQRGVVVIARRLFAGKRLAHDSTPTQDNERPTKKPATFVAGFSSFWCGWQESNPRPLGS